MEDLQSAIDGLRRHGEADDIKPPADPPGTEDLLYWWTHVARHWSSLLLLAAAPVLMCMDSASRLCNAVAFLLLMFVTYRVVNACAALVRTAFRTMANACARRSNQWGSNPAPEPIAPECEKGPLSAPHEPEPVKAMPREPEPEPAPPQSPLMPASPMPQEQKPTCGSPPGSELANKSPAPTAPLCGCLTTKGTPCRLRAGQCRYHHSGSQICATGADSGSQIPPA